MAGFALAVRRRFSAEPSTARAEAEIRTLDVPMARGKKTGKKIPAGGGFNLFSWRKIEETYSSCWIAQRLSNDDS